jgi:hypothetical protein
MAFNPFHAFRKHQKAFFAALTILCMVTFVLAGSMSGGGDFFWEMQRLLGGQGRYPTVATLYGKRIDVKELDEVRNQRVLANEYITRCVDAAWMSTMRLLSSEKYRHLMPQVQQSGGKELERIRKALEGIGKRDEANLLALAAAARDKQARRYFRQQTNELYFGGSTTTASLLDFLIWRHQADQLGIQLTEKDIKNEIGHETLDLLVPEEFRQIDQSFDRRQRMITREQLLAALGNEFRVRMAQTALLGPEASLSGQPSAPVTPYEFWQFYRDNRTAVTADLLPVPVSEFIDQVKEQPTEEELLKLFEKYKTQDYAPDSLTPGFKLPRRVQMEWVSANANSPVYRKAAEVTAAGLQATMPLGFDALLRREYEATKRPRFQVPSWTDTWTPFQFQFPLHESSQNHPATVAATLGQVLATAGTGGSAFAVPCAADGTAVGREITDRVSRGTTMLLGGADMLPLLPAGLVYHSTPKDEFLPLSTVRDQVLERVREDLAQHLLASNLNAVKKELEALKGKPKEAEAYVKKAVERYDLKHGATDKPLDRYEINAAGAGLLPLKESYLRNHRDDPRAKNFSSLFFTPAGLYTPARFPPAFGFRESEEWQPNEEAFLFWKTFNQDAKVPTFAEVKDKVEPDRYLATPKGAWLFEKARVLAQARAEEIAKEARDSKGDAVRVLTERRKNTGPLITLEGVERLKLRRSAMFSLEGRQYEAYQVPEDKIEYPPAGGEMKDFLDKLLALKDKGDATVLHDGPKKTYYVAALFQRSEPSVSDFYLSYKEAAPDSLKHDMLWELFEQERREAYRKDFMTQLRAQAGLLDEDGNLKINKDAVPREGPAEE